MTAGQDSARQRFAQARVARLATADAGGRPHLVPVVFAVSGATIYTAVDEKPKRSKALRRLANVVANPRVAVLVDHYDEDWETLWWVRADGAGRVLDPATPEARDALARLAERYPQYRSQPPTGPVLAIDVDNWASWSARSAAGS
jgi:PPOX class probable F420-dependent enzyme